MSDTLDLPVVDLTEILTAGGKYDSPEISKQAAVASAALKQYGLLCVRDPRAMTGVTNEDFLDMLEQYFEQPEDMKDQDVRKDIWYQLGRTPSRVELPRNHCKRMNLLADVDKPLSACPPEADAKER
jgi:isopenicillin N synthase-like dioxygenase